MTSNVWSFAPCARSNLAQVTKADLQATFCSADEDAKGRGAFGSKWLRSHGPGPSSMAIWVRHGEVVLAKHNSRPSVMYVLEITEQEQYSLRVRYVEVAQ